MRFARRRPDDLPPSRLVVPAGTDLLRLAGAWFAEPAWLVDPRTARISQKRAAPVGARFGGQPDAVPDVARLKLADDVVVTGPLPAKTVGAWLEQLPGDRALRSNADVYEFPDLALAWVRVVARRSNGAVVTPDGVENRWGATHLARLTLYSPYRLDADSAATVLQDALPAAQVSWVQSSSLDASYAVRHNLPYDGSVLVRYDLASDSMPLALKDADWRDVGPHVYQLGWVPAHDVEAIAPHPGTDLSGSEAEAIQRATSWIARAARLLRERVGGSVLDAEGFIAD